MFISLNASMYFFSLLILVFSLLFFLTIGGVFQAYVYRKIDNDAIEDDTSFSWNPIHHIELFVFVVFIFFGILVSLKKQPFLHKWADGIKGIIQKILFMFSGGCFHLFCASIFLFFGTLLWKSPFIFLALKTSLKADYHFIFDIKNILGVQGPKLILATFSLVSIAINLHIAMLDFLFSILDFTLRKYLLSYMLDFKFILGIYLLFLIFFLLYGNAIMYFFWRVISSPLYLLL